MPEGSDRLTVRIHRFYRNVVTDVECRECDYFEPSWITKSLQEIINHVDATGHRVYFKSVDACSADKNSHQTPTAEEHAERFPERDARESL